MFHDVCVYLENDASVFDARHARSVYATRVAANARFTRRQMFRAAAPCFIFCRKISRLRRRLPRLMPALDAHADAGACCAVFHACLMISRRREDKAGAGAVAGAACACV